MSHVTFSLTATAITDISLTLHNSQMKQFIIVLAQNHLQLIVRIVNRIHLRQNCNRWKLSGNTNRKGKLMAPPHPQTTD